MRKLFAILTALFFFVGQAWATMPNQLKASRMTDATLASTIDNHVRDLETAITDILGIPIDTNISAALFDVTSSGLTRVNFVSLADGTPEGGQLWISTTTANTLKYNDGTTTRSLVDLSLTQTLENKTLTAPTLSGTVAGTYTIGGTPTVGVSMTWSAAQNFNSQALTNVNIDSGTIDGTTITAPTLSGTLAGTYTIGGTPTVGVSMTWSAAQNLNSQALTNVNIDSGTVDGVTITSPTLAGTAAGTYTIGGTPTLSVDLTMSGTPAFGATGAANRASGFFGGQLDLADPGADHNFSQHSANATGNVLSFYKSRGTEASPSLITGGDDILRLDFYGHDGNAYLKTAHILVESLSGPSAGHITSGMDFWLGFDADEVNMIRLRPDDTYVNTSATNSYPSLHIGYPLVLSNGMSGGDAFTVKGGGSPGAPDYVGVPGDPAFGIVGTGNLIKFFTDGAERVRFNNVGDVKMGGTANRSGTAGTNHLDIFNGTAPVGTLANGISLYSAAGEATVMDAGGTATVISPHPRAFLDSLPITDRPFPWAYESVNPFLGKRIQVDLAGLLMATVLRAGRAHSEFIIVTDLPPEEQRDWDEDQEKLWQQREIERDKARRDGSVVPPPHQKVPPPKWMRDRGVRSAIP